MKQTAWTGSERLTMSSLATLSVGVLVLDRAGQPILINPAARRLGLSRATPVSGQQVPSEQPHPIVKALAARVTMTGAPAALETDLSGTASGMPTTIALRACVLPQGYVLVEASDVTEAHRMARMRRDFVANVSHELKTPVGALRLLADALLDASQPGEEDPTAIPRFARRIRHESTRLARLTAELLELSRLLGAEPLPAPLPVAVDRIVAEVVDRSRTAAMGKHMTVRCVGQRGLVAYGNETQLVTAVANLVDNAIAYSPSDTTVTIATESSDHVIDITIKDEGIGIEERHLDRIFERFYRVDKARSRDTGGTGLGLSIVKHIATNHAGRVAVASTVGKGSVFTLTLPARPPTTGPNHDEDWPAPSRL
jgi:two-component system sensor histidine kinase SenX3